MTNKKYWQSFSERTESDASKQSGKDEFNEELPLASEGFLKSVAPRRDFLKYLGFSTTAAAIAASCDIPVKKAIPFTNKPEDIVPGVANFYATTYVQDGDVVPVLAKVRDGRPIKIEGNQSSPLTQGGTSARSQASVLDLYDTARLRFPTIDGKEVTLDAVDKAVSGVLGGAPIVLLTSTIVSPSGKEVIAQFLAKYPGSRHVQYDGVSYSAMLLANQATNGKRALPSYDFSKAKVIVSLGADFLGTWLTPVVFNRQYAFGRKINEKNPQMSKHYQFEGIPTLTGSNADEKYLCRASETGVVAVALLNAINGQGATGIQDAKLKAGIEKAAKDLVANKGAGLVVAGSNDVNVQLVVNAINQAIGATGTTIDWSSTLNTRQGIDTDFAKLVEDMNGGAIGALIIHGANPAYTWFDSKRFTDGLKKVKVTISLSQKIDETTELCKYVIPDHNYLESWGDAEPRTGYVSFIQPTIYPLFKTRQWQDTLLKWSGAPTDYLAFLKTFWGGKLGGEAGWNKALQDGVYNGTTGLTTTTTNTSAANTAQANTATPPAAAPVNAGGGFNGGSLASATAAIASKKAGKVDLQLYQKVGIGEGQGSSNPWLLELPDPVSRVSWDNYVIVSPAMARTLLDIDLNNGGQADAFEVNPAKKVVKVTVNGRSVLLPAMIIPGTHPDTIGIAVGYGRNEKFGRASVGVGQNVYPLAGWNGNSVEYTNANVTIEVTGDTYDLARMQTHNRYDTSQGERTEVVKEMSFAAFKHEPDEILKEREQEVAPYGGLAKFDKEGTMYPMYDRPGIQWGMTIDMNSCTGCSACVIACHTENNVPIVGKTEVKRFHDMHWLRIDRYHSGDMDNPNVVFQPMLCQHCNNAPCENVCPVNATNHNSEGVNQMIYNRCIGTRYCANNCPYKVRRFNWSDYMGADSFPDNQDELADVIHVMNDDLTRMVLNPDVTVRSRGVMEKCTFCVQRTQEGKLNAKKQSRPLKSGQNNEWDVKTACQQACPTDAIVFGNLNDRTSAVFQERVNNPNRTYYVLEQLHTMPSVSYLAKVRNSDLMKPEHTGKGEEDGPPAA